MRRAYMLLAVGCLLTAARAQDWTGPYQLTSSALDDVNPSSCKEYLPGYSTCLVWQRMVAESWNIFGQFGGLYDGNGWSPEMAVTRDSVYGNVNPVVACLNDWQTGPTFCCAWEHKLSPLAGIVRASFITHGDSCWGSPVDLGVCSHTDGDSAMPSIITINGESADTVWVVWRNHDTSGAYIRCAYHAGDSWSTPEIAVAADLKHARLGRADVPSGTRPMLVWEQTGDIWYSIHDSSGWTSPIEVAPSDSEDHDPDIVSSGVLMSWGSYVVWQSMRDGDTAIYIAGTDSLATGQRVSGGHGNFNPVGANIAFTTLESWGCVVAWVSDRNGNPDIYTNYYSGLDARVDSNSADDLSPVVTSMGNGLGAQMVWVLWQSNRNGNWDIFGSYRYNSGVEESHQPQASGRKLAATVVRGAIWLAPTTSPKPQAASLLDISGRKVMDLHPGANDVSRLAPGVYFVRSEPLAVSRKPSAVTKVVVTR